MTRVRIVLLFHVVALTAVAASAQRHPNVEVGFKAERVYQFSDLDSVSLFNGNLTISIPLGLRYPVGPTLSYQFALTYNSKVWDYGMTDNRQVATPNRRSNAGVGWRLSFGRLSSPADHTAVFQENGPAWIYEGPAGDEHSFCSSVCPTNFKGTLDALDNSGLMLVSDDDHDASVRRIDFPNGEQHTFVYEDGQYRLKKMADRFGNYVMFTYEPLQWTIEDSVGRVHFVTFTHYQLFDDNFDHGDTVTSVQTQTATNEKAIYGLTYDNDFQVNYGCGHQPPAADPDEISENFPLLKSITLPGPAGAQEHFTFDYNRTPPFNCSQGTLSSWKLPTGGQISYEYTQYRLAGGDTCNAPRIITQSPGISKKTTIDGVTEYRQVLGPDVAVQYEATYAPHHWSRTSVLSPIVGGKRTRSDHYFNVWLGSTAQSADPFGADGFYYGWPITAAAPSVAESMKALPGEFEVQKPDVSASTDGRFLSSRVFDGCSPDSSGECGSGIFRRSESLRYVSLGRSGGVVESSRTVFEDDREVRDAQDRVIEPACGPAEPCYVQVDNSAWDDAVRHFRTSVQSSNFPGDHAVTTTKDYHHPASDKPWLADLVDKITTTENGATALAWQCFDDNGFLTRMRVAAGAGAGETDLLTVFTPDANGNVASEASYGGDSTAFRIGGTNACDATLPQRPRYAMRHTYVAGVLASSQYFDTATWGANPRSCRF
jgi:hypothetical protein